MAQWPSVPVTLPEDPSLIPSMPTATQKPAVTGSRGVFDALFWTLGTKHTPSAQTYKLAEPANIFLFKPHGVCYTLEESYGNYLQFGHSSLLHYNLDCPKQNNKNLYPVSRGGPQNCRLGNSILSSLVNDGN